MKDLYFNRTHRKRLLLFTIIYTNFYCTSTCKVISRMCFIIENTEIISEFLTNYGFEGKLKHSLENCNWYDFRIVLNFK